MLALAVCCVSDFVSAPAADARSLQDPNASIAAPAPAPAWTFDLVPYAWIPSVNGTITIDGQEVDVEDGGDGFFGVSGLGGFLGHFEANHGPWSFVVAPIWLNLDFHGGQPPNTDADLSLRAQVHEAFVAREFAPGWEWMIGARYQRLETDLDLSVGGVPTSSHQSGRSWTDPIVGLRYQTDLGADWSLNLRADIGGFGVGSEFAWNASAIANYHFSSLVAMQLGYRVLSFDFQSGGGAERLEYNLSLYGPIIGVSFSF